MAHFKIHESFELTDVGIVLAGEVLDGNISTGDIFIVDPDNSELQVPIIAVESINGTNPNINIGLIVEFDNKNNIQHLNWTRAEVISK